MIEIFTARSGAPSARIKGIALHSPYDPAREADRFVRESIGTENPATIVILGEGLGHVSDAAARAYPLAHLLRVRYAAGLTGWAGASTGPSWDPDSVQGLAEFLRLNLTELDVEGLRVLEWPPSARVLPAVSIAANAALRQVVAELNGSLVTTIGAGRLWLRNCVANFIGIDSVLTGVPCAPDRPVLVAAPGPTLEEAAPLIAELRRGVDLWALPSSALLLQQAGIDPDLVIMTDPGFYSMHHLQFAPPRCPIAMPLSAARGSWCLPPGAGGHRGWFLLAQPGLVENALLQASGVHAPLVPPHGTVAASALDLALASTSGPVIAAGLDMCTRDISSHARPNAFDLLLHLQSSRLLPHYGATYARAVGQQAEPMDGARGTRTSPALRTYAGWFDGPERNARGRLLRLFPSSIPLRGMQDIDAAGLRRVLGTAATSRAGPRLSMHHGYPADSDRRRIIGHLVDGWIDEFRLGRAAAADNGLGALGRAPSLLSLAYLIEPRLLLEARRKFRRRDGEGARAVAEQMLEQCERFLDALRRDPADGG